LIPAYGDTLQLPDAQSGDEEAARPVEVRERLQELRPAAVPELRPFRATRWAEGQPIGTHYAAGVLA